MTAMRLRDEIAGSLVVPGEADWDAARLFHSGIGEPELIVRAADVDDVRRAVRYAADAGLTVGVRGGGHSAWGTVPGGLLIDLARLDAVAVDGDVVRVGGGATWGRVAAALAPHGLAVSSGDTASVGVGGLTLGGGIGWMVRAWGLACDQLVAAEVVTADGAVLTASAAEHPDLFAALRGGGGNFGVVTRFDFAAHPLEAVALARFEVGQDRAAALRAVRELMRDAPRELTVTYLDVPSVDPSAPAGASLTAVWAGPDAAAAAHALSALVDGGVFGPAEVSVVPYPDVLQDLPPYDPAQPVPSFIGGNALLDELDDTTVERLVRFRAERPLAVLLLRSLGGAYGDIAAAESVFPARTATWFAMAGAFDVPGMTDDAARASALRDWAEIDQASAGVYGNFTTTTDAALAARMYPGAVGERLARAKARWDPGNVFARNHNVPPAGAADGTS